MSNKKAEYKYGKCKLHIYINVETMLHILKNLPSFIKKDVRSVFITVFWLTMHTITFFCLATKESLWHINNIAIPTALYSLYFICVSIQPHFPLTST